MDQKSHALNAHASADPDAAIDLKITQLRESLPSLAPELALNRFQALHTQVDLRIGIRKRRLLATSLAWADDERGASAGIHSVCHRMARIGRRLFDALSSDTQAPDERILDISALTLHYLGETVKCEIAVGHRDPYDYQGTHAIMKRALALGRQREERPFTCDGRTMNCTIEALYFRALLLARFTSGKLNSKQIEILDACIWMWLPVLRSVRDAPPGSALRADLDSSEGLRRGPRSDGAENSLYLPQEPIEAAYYAIVREFHAGRIVPAEGISTEFRIEEHVAVLNMIRQELRESRREPAPRAERRAVGFDAEVFVGLTEIMVRGFRKSAQPLEGIGRPARGAGPGGDPTSSIYDPVHRRILWTDESATGLGASWRPGDCSEIALGDLVGIRRSWGEPLIIGHVVRSVPAPDGGRVEIGVAILSIAVQPITVARPSNGQPEPGIDMLFVSGNDASGRHDAYLVPDRLYRDVGPFEVTVGDDVYSFRFNRMRERGNGWALAGFEITATRRLAVVPAAA